MRLNAVYLSPKNIGVWAGMNYFADKELKTKLKLRKNSALIDNSFSRSEKHKILVHEEVEAYYMKCKKLPYKKAHRIALKAEKMIK